MTSDAQLVREGQAALEAARWESAREAFEAALVVRPSADAWDGLGQARWFLGDVDGGIEARAHAFEEHVRAGACDRAARAAAWISHQHHLSGRSSAARGWLARAQRALEGIEHCPGHGWIAVERARHADSVDACIALSTEALRVARETDSGELEVFALSLLGRAQVSAGRHEEGMALLEEAMAAASAGAVRNVQTLGEAYCNLITACTSAGEWARADEWCDMVGVFAQEHEVIPLFGACRTIHADVLVAKGRWPEAEAALESALAAHARHLPEMGADTVATLAELRVRQGRIAAAEQLLAGREEHAASLRALARVRLAQARPEVAVALLERGLRATEGDAMGATQLLAALVDARLAAGDLPGAGAAAEELGALARSTGSDLVRGRADLAAARVQLAHGRPGAGADPAQHALAVFGRLGMPLDVGEARLELARALASRAPDLARDEAWTALATFKELGAVRSVDAAAAVLRELGAGTPGRPQAAGELTAREEEVLELLGQGMTNAQIALALVISEKTAGHHVSRILRKLGVRNRAEAAAHVARAARPPAA